MNTIVTAAAEPATGAIAEIFALEQIRPNPGHIRRPRSSVGIPLA